MTFFLNRKADGKYFCHGQYTIVNLKHFSIELNCNIIFSNMKNIN